MEPVLVDTTIWINFLNGIVDPQTDLLARYIANGHAVLTCPVVVQEVLQGIRDERQFSILSLRIQT